MTEVFASESPGPGWTNAGAGRWVKDGTEKAGTSIAVIGGGPGGLFTSYILNQCWPDAAITIYESSGRLGGKIKTDKFDDGTKFEAGVAELYEYLGPGGRDPLRVLIEDELKLKTVDMAGGGVIVGETVYPSMDDVPEPSLGRLKQFHARVAELMPLDKFANRWQPENSHPWAPRTFYDCILSELPNDDLAVRYVETAVHSDLATESWTCNGLNGIKNVLMDNDEYMQLYHVVGGIGKVAKALRENITADVHLETRCVKVERADGDKYLVTTRRGDDVKVEAFDAVIVCMPNHWLGQIEWTGKLKEGIHRICSHYDLPAHYLRVSLLFSSPWWDALELPGDFWMMSIGAGCCCYNESHRWQAERGHVLSFLLAGVEAQLLCSSNQKDKEIVQWLLDSLPDVMRTQQAELIDYRVNRFVGSINAQPGGWPSKELRAEHTPDKQDHPAVKLCGDYFFDSTLNAALFSANVAVEELLEHFGRKSESSAESIKQLETNGAALAIDEYENTERKIVEPPVGSDGLFEQPDDAGPDRETVEQHNRERFANHFHYADPFAGNTRTFDEQGDYNCGRCNMADGDKCLLVDLKMIDRDAGSCADWEGIDAGDSEIPLRLKSAEDSGYGIAENGKGFGCARCPYASKAYKSDSQGRDLYCGKGDFRVFGNSCCGINGAALVPIDDKGVPV